MKYFPKEIAAKNFDRKMMGYDPDQVEDYLVAIAAQMEALLQENTYIKSTLREKEIDLIQYKDREQLLQQTMTHASQTTEKMKQDADRDGKLIVEEAHQKAEMIVGEAKASLRKMYQEIWNDCFFWFESIHSLSQNIFFVACVLNYITNARTRWD